MGALWGFSMNALASEVPKSLIKSNQLKMAILKVWVQIEDNNDGCYAGYYIFCF